MSKKALFIVEGRDREPKLIESIYKNFFEDVKEELEIIPYTTNIYGLYNDLKKEGEFVDLFIQIKRKLQQDKSNEKFYEKIKDIKSKEIAYTYLFFDYDGHDDRASPETLETMLDYFDEETEKGKLYISYPTVEALKHLKSKNDSEFNERIIESSAGYKGIVGKESCYQDIRKYDRVVWENMVYQNICKINYIFNGVEDKLEYKEFLKIKQLNIFQKQLQKYIIPLSKVSVLSGIALFIPDYFGKKIYNSINKDFVITYKEARDE